MQSWGQRTNVFLILKKPLWVASHHRMQHLSHWQSCITTGTSDRIGPQGMMCWIKGTTRSGEAIAPKRSCNAIINKKLIVKRVVHFWNPSPRPENWMLSQCFATTLWSFFKEASCFQKVSFTKPDLRWCWHWLAMALQGFNQEFGLALPGDAKEWTLDLLHVEHLLCYLAMAHPWVFMLLQDVT